MAVGRLFLHSIGLVDAPVMYTASVGFYILWIVIRFSATLISHALQGVKLFWRQIVSWMGLLVRCMIAGTILFGIIPLIMGHLVELILLSPLRVPVDKLPVFYPSTVSYLNECMGTTLLENELWTTKDAPKNNRGLKMVLRDLSFSERLSCSSISQNGIGEDISRAEGE